MKTFLAGLMLVSAMGTSAVAQEYRCQLKVSKADGWVPKEVVIFRDGDAVTVLDPIIQYYKKKPLQAKVSVDNAKRVTFAWTLDGIKNASGQYVSGMIYRASIQKASNKVQIIAKPQRYANQFRGNGVCEVKTK